MAALVSLAALLILAVLVPILAIVTVLWLIMGAPTEKKDDAFAAAHPTIPQQKAPPP